MQSFIRYTALDIKQKQINAIMDGNQMDFSMPNEKRGPANTIKFFVH